MRRPGAPPLVLLAALALAGCADPAAPGEAAPGADSTAAEPAGAPADPAWPDLEDAALRPGDKLLPQDVELAPPAFSLRSCTVNFVFASPDNRSLYVGTASHCVSGMKVGDPLRVSGVADAVLAYCSWGAMEGSATCADKIGDDKVTLDRAFPNDFALFRIDDADRAKVHPAVRHWGGPTGLAGPPAARASVLTYGNSAARDAGQRGVEAQDAREGYVTGSDAWWTDVVLLGPSVPGDSGSPVLLADGRALGVVKTLDYGTNGVMNLDAALAFLHGATGLRVELRTWPLLAPPALPRLA